jgi:hypothetical protein
VHFILYVCLPLEQAQTGRQAREGAVQYLSEEGFHCEDDGESKGRFLGASDYFSVGDRYSGTLTLLRLKHLHPEKFGSFWKQYQNMRTPKTSTALFRKSFPEFRGRVPVAREKVGFYGYKDDAQIMDEVLFEELKRGFGKKQRYEYELEKPNVITTGEWPKDKSSVIGNYWIVVIDYHD